METKDLLNDLIFDLYDLSLKDKRRVLDSLIIKEKVTKKLLVTYMEQLQQGLQIFFKNPIKQDYFYYKAFNLVVLGIFFNDAESSNPSTKKVSRHSLNEIFKNDPSENFLASQEKLYGNDCIYILKKDLNYNWSQTKAYEDSQEIPVSYTHLTLPTILLV